MASRWDTPHLTQKSPGRGPNHEDFAGHGCRNEVKRRSHNLIEGAYRPRHPISGAESPPLDRCDQQ